MNFKFNEYPMRKIRTLFIFALLVFAILSNLYAESIQCVWTGIKRIVAVGDLHGDYENFIKILKGTGLIDEEKHWIAGKTHFVQIGDVMDRGNYAKEIFDLLMKLEKEAEEAGGKVHMLIGNHEEMNITGIAFDYSGYITPRQFVSFVSEKYREKEEKKIRKEDKGNPAEKAGTNSSLNSEMEAHWEKVINMARNNTQNQDRREYIKNFNEKYGNWILEHNVVIKINDIIFVHGGISEKFSKKKLQEINDRTRIELTDIRRAIINSRPTNIRREIVWEPDSPYWYRDLAIMSEENFKDDVDRILNNIEAQYMVIAHTPMRIINEDHMKRFDGKIWIIDTGISKIYGGYLSALIIENGKFIVWPPSLRTEKDNPFEFMRWFQEGIWISDTRIPEAFGNYLSDIIIENNRKYFFIQGGDDEN